MAEYDIVAFLAALIVFDFNRILEGYDGVLTPNLLDYITNSVEGDTKLIIFGMGHYGKSCYKLFSKTNIKNRIVALWDNKATYASFAFNGISVVVPNDEYLNSNTKIIIAAKDQDEMMRKQLNGLGYMDRNIVKYVDVFRQMYKFMFRTQYSILASLLLSDS